MPFWFGTCPFVFPFYLFFLIKTIGLSVKRQGVRRECLPPNICIHNGLWNEDTWWSDGRGGGLQGMREQFSSLLFLMWELLWGWCCYSGLFLCASGHPFSSHLLQTLAVREREENRLSRLLQTYVCAFEVFNTASGNIRQHVKRT